jgi:hypothetical protein
VLYVLLLRHKITDERRGKLPRVLLDRVADVAVINSRGISVLAIAQRYRPKVVTLLESYIRKVVPEETLVSQACQLVQKSLYPLSNIAYSSQE